MDLSFRFELRLAPSCVRHCPKEAIYKVILDKRMACMCWTVSWAMVHPDGQPLFFCSCKLLGMILVVLLSLPANKDLTSEVVLDQLGTPWPVVKMSASTYTYAGLQTKCQWKECRHIVDGLMLKRQKAEDKMWDNVENTWNEILDSSLTSSREKDSWLMTQNTPTSFLLLATLKLPNVDLFYEISFKSQKSVWKLFQVFFFLLSFGSVKATFGTSNYGYES